MGVSCSSCFGKNDNPHRHVHRKSLTGQLSQEGRQSKRELMGAAAEERAAQLESRGGSGELSKKLAAQSKGSHSTAPLGGAPLQVAAVPSTSYWLKVNKATIPRSTRTVVMAATVERVEEALQEAGFIHPLPINSSVFAGGDGGAVEEAPLGYYRFHFWKNDEQWREHENWIANTDVTGPMCLSLMEDQQGGGRTFYRLLIRTIFATKSVVLFEDDLKEWLGDPKSPSKTARRMRIIGAGLRAFLEHERDRMIALEDEFGAMSIRTSCTISSMADESVRNLPSSRLHEASSAAGGSVARSEKSSGEASVTSLSRRQSTRAPSDTRSEKSAEFEDSTMVPIGYDDKPACFANDLFTLPERPGALRRQFKEAVQVNPFELAKSFTQLKDKDFYPVLLNLECALDPKVCHLDVVIAEGSIAKPQQFGETWEALSGLLGMRLTRTFYKHQAALFLSKQGRVPSDVTAEFMHERKQQSPTDTLSKETKFLSAEEESPKKVETRKNRLIEFVMNEYRYLSKLCLIRDFFLIPYGPQSKSKILDQTTFLKIFEGFDQFIPIHERILKGILGISSEELSSFPREATFKAFVTEAVEEERVRATSICQQIMEACDERLLEKYSQIVSDYQVRIESIKVLDRLNPAFHDQLEAAASDPRANRQFLTDIFSNTFQHLTRYKHQLAIIMEATRQDSPEAACLLQAHDEVDKKLHILELVKERRDDTEFLFELQRRILNCPADICKSTRSYLTKMAAYEVERGEANFSRRMTLVLCNDLVIGARKIRSQRGRLDSLKPHTSGSKSAERKTHEFMFLCPIGGIQVKRVEVTTKVRRHQVKSFTVELDPSMTMVWHEDRIQPLSECIDQVNSHLLLVSKKQEKLSIWLEKFDHAQQQAFLDESPAEIFFKRTARKDFYFHVYRQADYQQWQHKNRLALLYTHQAPIPSMEDLFPSEDHTSPVEALIFIQALHCAFRWTVRTRSCIVAASECFEMSREFASAQVIEAPLFKAISNCHQLHFIYPPFAMQFQLQMRQQLVHHIEPFSRGLMRKFKELVNKLQKVEVAKPLDDVETPGIPTSLMDGKLADQSLKKPSMLGKVFGRIRSPLSRKLDYIPE